MPVPLQNDASITTLRVKLANRAAADTPLPAQDASSKASSSTRIICELVLTGNVEERGFASSVNERSGMSMSRRKNSSARPTYLSVEADLPPVTTRTLAQWSFAPEELQLPIDYHAVVNFSDKPKLPSAWMGDLARFAAGRLLSDMRVDGLVRFAAAQKWLPSGKPTLPPAMLRQLQGLLQFALRPGENLWLEIANPPGYLPLLPWEELLAGATHSAVLRLSPHPVQSWSPAQALTIVTCISAASQKRMPKAAQVGAMLEAMRRALPEKSVVHVFADDLCRTPLTELVATSSPADEQHRSIVVHPSMMPLASDTGIGTSWSDWIADVIGDRAVDIFHSISAASLFADNARLIMARDPGGVEPATGTAAGDGKRLGRPLRYVAPSELSALLTRFGAWAAFFSTPPGDGDSLQSRLGLKLMVDQIARSRPGVAVFHSAQDDKDLTALEHAVAFIVGDISVAARPTPALALYCHPARAIRTPVLPATLSPELFAEYSRVRTSLDQVVINGGNLPAWVASTQRILETAVSRAVGPATSNDESVMKGLTAAIKLIDGLVSMASPPEVSANNMVAPRSRAEGTDV